MTTFHIDKDGNLLRATSDPDAVVDGAVETTEVEPKSGRAKWNGAAWIEPLPVPPEDTPTQPEDVLRALIAKGLLTQADIDQAKRNRP